MRAVTSHLNARVLAGFKAMYKIDHLLDPFAAGAIEAVSVTWVVIFAVTCGETVPLARRIAVPQINIEPAFDQV
jgi:hypothetical protein